MSPLVKLAEARRRHLAAKEAFKAATERAFPLGAWVAATIGNKRIYGPVTGHCYSPGYIQVTNDKAGKTRTFYAGDRSLHDVSVVSMPTGHAQEGK